MSVLTADMMRRTMDELLKSMPPPAPQVRFSIMAVKQDGYHFKPSRSRSKRLHKKLMRRYGGYERYKPAIFRMQDPVSSREVIVAHPSFADLMPKASMASIADPWKINMMCV